MTSFLTSSSDSASSIIDAAAHSADDAIRGSQRVANSTLDQLAGQVESARSRVGPALDGLASDAAHLAQRSTAALRRQSAHLRDQTLHARDATRGYIQHEPLKSVLMAAAAGAALVLLSSLLTRRGSH